MEVEYHLFYFHLFFLFFFYQWFSPSFVIIITKLLSLLSPLSLSCCHLLPSCRYSYFLVSSSSSSYRYHSLFHFQMTKTCLLNSCPIASNIFACCMTMISKRTKIKHSQKIVSTLKNEWKMKWNDNLEIIVAIKNFTFWQYFCNYILPYIYSNYIHCSVTV